MFPVFHQISRSCLKITLTMEPKVIVPSRAYYRRFIWVFCLRSEIIRILIYKLPVKFQLKINWRNKFLVSGAKEQKYVSKTSQVSGKALISGISMRYDGTVPRVFAPRRASRRTTILRQFRKIVPTRRALMYSGIYVPGLFERFLFQSRLSRGLQSRNSRNCHGTTAHS